MSNVSFLVTYFAQPDLLAICLDSIRKHHPGTSIIVSQQEGDYPVDIGDAKLIFHNMEKDQWAGAAEGLMKACGTDIGVFIEHDAFLMRNIGDLVEFMAEYDMIGPEEVIPLPKLDRFAPGMICQNFFVTNVAKMKFVGLENIRSRDVEDLNERGWRNIESGHGISQTFRNKMFLPVKPSGYAYGTYYSNAVHHMWYGSYRGRDTMKYDNVSPNFLDDEADRLISDYWNNRIVCA